MRLSSIFVSLARPAVSAVMGALFVFSLAACGPQKPETTNADMANQFSGEKHEGDIVSTKGSATHAENGTGVSMEAIHAIQDGIERVYSEDFNHCMEEEMERLGNMNVGGEFTFEITVETTGKVSEVQFLKVRVGETKPAPKQKETREADQFAPCLEARMKSDWEFSPPPEKRYKHTYYGKAGAAW
jgi:hypothetical protein